MEVAVAGNCPKRQEFALKHRAQQQQQLSVEEQMHGIFLWLLISPLRGGSVLLHYNINNNNFLKKLPQKTSSKKLPQQLPVCQHGCAYLPVDVLTRVILGSVTSALEIFRGNTSINLHNVINTALMGKQ